jgi:excisionase family DNA binding protein
MAKLLTLDQVAERLNVSKRSVRGLVASNRLKAVRINGRIIRIDERDLASVLTPVTPRVRACDGRV